MVLVYMVLTFTLNTIFHEAGHVIAMRRRNIPINYLMFGYRSKHVRVFTWRPAFLSFPVIISPILFGGHVSVDTDMVRDVRYTQTASIAGAGSLLEIVYGSLLASVSLSQCIANDYRIPAALLSLALLVLTFRRPLSWMLPALMPLFAIALVGIVCLIICNYVLAVATLSYVVTGGSWAPICAMMGLVFIANGMMNALPIKGHDGRIILSGAIKAASKRYGKQT